MVDEMMPGEGAVMNCSTNCSSAIFLKRAISPSIGLMSR